METELPSKEEIKRIVQKKLNEGNYAEAAELMVLYPILRMGADKFAEGLLRSAESYLELREILAAVNHAAWTHWSKQLLAEEKALSSKRYTRWRKLWIPYEDLPESFKQINREWASKMVLEVMRWKSRNSSDNTHYRHLNRNQS